MGKRSERKSEILWNVCWKFPAKTHFATGMMRWRRSFPETCSWRSNPKIHDMSLWVNSCKRNSPCWFFMLLHDMQEHIAVYRHTSFYLLAAVFVATTLKRRKMLESRPSPPSERCQGDLSLETAHFWWLWSSLWVHKGPDMDEGTHWFAQPRLRKVKQCECRKDYTKLKDAKFLLQFWAIFFLRITGSVRTPGDFHVLDAPQSWVESCAMRSPNLQIAQMDPKIYWLLKSYWFMILWFIVPALIGDCPPQTHGRPARQRHLRKLDRFCCRSHWQTRLLSS